MERRAKLNEAWFRDFLTSSAAREVAHEGAERVLAEAQSIAPVDTGDYRDSLHIESATTDRAVERVAFGVWYGYIVEARDRVLSRALDAL